MRYGFRCGDCDHEQELSCSWSARPSVLPCPECGGTAEPVISGGGEVMVLGNQRPWRLDHTCVPIGWEKGNTDPDKQEARYRTLINETRKLAIQNDKAAIKGGIRHVASVPREVHRMRTGQYGKDYYETDTKRKLKEDGLLFKN